MDNTVPEPPTAAAASGIAIREDGTVLADGRPLALSPTERLLLRALVAAGGRALSRKEILRAMHGGPGNVREESLNFTVHALRAKLGRHWPSLRTVWGRGYAWQPATVSDLRRTRRRRIVLASTTALACCLWSMEAAISGAYARCVMRVSRISMPASSTRD